jgi:hypothetical protein
MTLTLGNISPDDDYTHPLGPEPNFNESMYFNFFDRNRGVGGFVRLGNRANEGRAEMTVTVYLPDGRVLFNFARPAIDNNDSFEAGGMCFTVVEPGHHLRTTYSGQVVELADPTQMAEPRRAFTDNPSRPLSLELDHVAVGPMYGSSGDKSEDKLPDDQQFAKAHYEQHMRVSGRLLLGDETVEINGHGLRDHSWGPRYWQAIEGYEWLTMNFGDDLGAMVSIIRRGPDDIRLGGVVVEGDKIDRVTGVKIDADYEANGLYHRALRVHISTASGREFDINGEVKGFIPLRNRRGGMTTHIGEGMTEWTMNGRTGYGLSEFLRQV